MWAEPLTQLVCNNINLQYCVTSAASAGRFDIPVIANTNAAPHDSFLCHLHVFHIMFIEIYKLY